MLDCGDPHRKKAWLTWSKENSWEDFAPVWRKFSLSHVSRALYGAWVLPLTFLMHFRLSVALCKLMNTCPTWFYVGQIWGWSEIWFLSRPVEQYSVHAKLWLEPIRLYFVDVNLDFFFFNSLGVNRMICAFPIFSFGKGEENRWAVSLFFPFLLDTLPRRVSKSGYKNQASAPELSFLTLLILRNPGFVISDPRKEDLSRKIPCLMSFLFSFWLCLVTCGI